MTASFEDDEQAAVVKALRRDIQALEHAPDMTALRQQARELDDRITDAWTSLIDDEYMSTLRIELTFSIRLRLDDLSK